MLNTDSADSGLFLTAGFSQGAGDRVICVTEAFLRLTARVPSSVILGANLAIHSSLTS